MKSDLSILKKVLSLPTAPFHEEAVIRYVINFCKELGLRPRQDRYGNIKVTYKRGEKSKPIAFLAHMDHPGFEVVRGGSRPTVRLLGGVPEKYFAKAKVLIWEGGETIRGRVTDVVDKKRRIFRVQSKRPVSKSSFGTFDLVLVQWKKGLIKTKAADNLASVAILLNLLKILMTKKKRGHVTCLFTRAEEVGFVGAAGMVQKKWISQKTPIIVLEASSVKGGDIRMGAGPVLRVGDRASTFSNAMERMLHAVALLQKKKKKSFQFQRSLLSGGVCEATLFSLYQYPVGCLALPLGNYHNAGPKRYAPEMIHRKDYEGMLVWLLALVSWRHGFAVTRQMKKRIKGRSEKQIGRLRSVPL